MPCLPDNLLWLLTYLFDTVLDSRNASLADAFSARSA